MKKILLGILVLLLLAPLGFANKVNLTKSGTPWVWRVEAGEDLGYTLIETGAFLIFEDGSKALKELIPTEGGAYSALVGQGWVVTDSDANIPQGISAIESIALDLALNEASEYLLIETGNYLRLEN